MPVFNITAKQNDSVVDNPQESGEELIKTGETVSKVKVDGPLSNMFTEALQKVLASETIASDAGMLVLNLLDEEASEENPDLYVYCCDTDTMDASQLVESTNKLKVALDSGKYKKVTLLTQGKKINNKFVGLEEYARALGADVKYNPNIAIQSVLNYKRV